MTLTIKRVHVLIIGLVLVFGCATYTAGVLNTKSADQAEIAEANANAATAYAQLDTMYPSDCTPPDDINMPVLGRIPLPECTHFLNGSPSLP